MDTFTGKTVLITGASGDIGRACAMAFGRKGTRLILHSFRNPKAIQKIQEELMGTATVCAINCDASNEDAVVGQFKRITDEFAIAKIDVLINNAGDLIRRCPFEEMDWKLMQESINMNLKSAFLFTRYALPMIGSGGSIIFISSQTARWGKGDRSSHYGTAKAAIIGMSKCLSNEIAPKGVRVNCIAPGFIEGQFHQKYTAEHVAHEHAMRNPMRRNGTPEDVAGVAIFLASSQSSYVNGTVIDVCGGDFIAP